MQCYYKGYLVRIADARIPKCGIQFSAETGGGDVHTMRMGRENEKDKDGSRESVEQRRKGQEKCRIII